MSAARIAAAAALLGVAVGLGAGAWRTFVPAALAKPIQDELVLAQARPKSLDVRQLAALVAAAEDLRQRDPTDGQWQELVGRVELLAAAHPRTRDADRPAHVERAVDAFRQAARLRPSWPYAQVGLASAKSEAGQFDDELAAAIVAALAHGPNERRVHEDLAELRLRHGRELPEALRLRLQNLFPELVARDPARWINLADQHDDADWLCRLPALSLRASEYCVRLGWLSPEPAPR